MSHRFVVVLAGGRGERFWPWSRSDRPKQLRGGFGLFEGAARLGLHLLGLLFSARGVLIVVVRGVIVVIVRLGIVLGTASHHRAVSVQ